MWLRFTEVFQWCMNETKNELVSKSKTHPGYYSMFLRNSFWRVLPYEGISWETLGLRRFPWTHNSLSLRNNQTRGYFWHLLHITFLCCVDVTTIIGKVIRNAIGSGGGGGEGFWEGTGHRDTTYGHNSWPALHPRAAAAPLRGLINILVTIKMVKYSVP